MASPHTILSTRCRPDEFLESLHAREDTLVSDDPCPFPPEHRYLLNLEDIERGRIRIRHYSGPSEAISPILQVDLAPTPEGLSLTCLLLDAEAVFSPRAALELERMEQQEKQEGREELVLDVATLDFAAIAFHVVGWPLGRMLRGALALFGFVSHRLGAKTYKKRLLRLVEDTAQA